MALSKASKVYRWNGKTSAKNNPRCGAQLPAEPFYLRTERAIENLIKSETNELLKRGANAWHDGISRLNARRVEMLTELQEQKEAATSPEKRAARRAAYEASDLEARAFEALLTRG